MVTVSLRGSPFEALSLLKYTDEYVINVNLSQSWDWRDNHTEQETAITANPQNGTLPPQVVRGVLFQGLPSDNNLYLYGGTTSYGNTSFPGWRPPTNTTYTLWSFNTATTEWDPYNVGSSAPYRPSSGAAAEAPEQGLAFYFNGEIDSASAQGFSSVGSGDNLFLEGMVVINMTDHSVRNLSTTVVIGDQPRARGKMLYVPGLGEKGILVLLGGRGQNATDVPGPRVDFGLMVASAPDASGHNM